MIVYRISKEKYKNDMSGEGGYKSSGRWHFKGNPIIYASESKIIAKKEKQRGPSGKILPDGLVYVAYNIPDDIPIKIFTRKDLEGIPWDMTPYENGPGQDLGTGLLRENKYAVIKVPTVADEKSYNYIINPNHFAINRIEIVSSDEEVR